MSGSGRRSCYRKSVVDDFLHSLPELTGANEVVARVIGSRGTNIFEIEIPLMVSGESSMRNELAMMPSKFKKLIWMKRGDFIIVSNSNTDVDLLSAAADAAATDTTVSPKKPMEGEVHDTVNAPVETVFKPMNSNQPGTGGKVQYLIDHVLTKEQIIHLYKINKWPIAFKVPYLLGLTGQGTGYEDPMAGYPTGGDDDGEDEEGDYESEEEAPKVDKMGNTIE